MNLFKKYSIALLCGVMAASSCTNFLHEEPKVGVNAETYVDSYDKALSLVAASYAKLGDQEDGLMGSERFMMPTDLQEGRLDAGDMVLTPSSEQVSELWRKFYAFISTANNAIGHIQANAEVIDSSFEDSRIESNSFTSTYGVREDFSPARMLMGEARFMRAYAYFTLYRYFGGVPLVKELSSTTPEFVPRATRDELFAFIEEDLNYAKKYCAPNKAEGLSTLAYGRITSGAAAGLLAKAYVFQASYIRRAEMYGEKLDENPGSVSKEELYDKAIALCDSLIFQQIGQHHLENYYPSVFTNENSEVLFSVVAEAGSVGGTGIGNQNWGTEGSLLNGAQGGRGSTKWHALQYDLPTWGSTNDYVNVPSVLPVQDYGSTYKGLAQAWGSNEGEIYSGFDRLLPETMELNNTLTFTGDSTRRLWNVVKMIVTGSDPDQRFHTNLMEGLWIFEPFGKYTEEDGRPLSSSGKDYFIEPLKGDDYSNVESNILTEYAHNNINSIGFWKDTYDRDGEKRSDFDSDLFRMPRQFRFSKFRRPHPSNLPEGFQTDQSGVDYPILRLAEVYLLKAEALYFKGNTALAIEEVNKVRDRARHHAVNFADLFDMAGDAQYRYESNRPVDIPTSLSGEQALREILLERSRELCGEDDLRWFDISRYPDLYLDLGRGNHIYYNLSAYRDPYTAGVAFYNKSMEDRINTGERLYKILLPIPLFEFQYFPDMKQNPGY